MSGPGWPATGTTTSTMPERGAAVGLTTTGPGSAMDGPDGVDGPLGQPVADLAGLGVAVEDGVDHLVDRAGADGVVGGVADHPLPGHVQKGGRARRPARR